MLDTRNEGSSKDRGSLQQEPAWRCYHHDIQASPTRTTFQLDSLFDQLRYSELVVNGECSPLALVSGDWGACHTHVLSNEVPGGSDGTWRLSEAP